MFHFEGFSYFEGFFRWSIDGESTIYMHLERGDYIIEVHHVGLPESILAIRALSFSFYLNNNLLAEFDGESINSGNYILSLDVPQEYVHDGINIFEIRYDAWSPTEIDLPDGRLLGIGITKVEVIEVEPDA
jgi:hypothetical protein